MHCDAPKSVPDPFPSVMGSVTMYTIHSNGTLPLTLTLDARCGYTLTALWGCVNVGGYGRGPVRNLDKLHDLVDATESIFTKRTV